MDNYNQACEKLGRMKDGSFRPSRKIDYHTYLKLRERGVIAVLLHSTDIVKFYPDGTIVYNSGGWKTVTTRDRMNKFGPLSVWSDRGVWYVSNVSTWEGRDRHTFADGLAYRPETGEFKNVGPDPKKTIELRKRVVKYAKAFMAAFEKGDVPEPRLCDCMFCSRFERAGSRNGDHILSHIEESYFVSSLLVNAMEEFGASIAERDIISQRWQGATSVFESHDRGDHFLRHIEKYIKRYCYRRLGLAA